LLQGTVLSNLISFSYKTIAILQKLDIFTQGNVYVIIMGLHFLSVFPNNVNEQKKLAMHSVAHS